jgi:hypothetical protein
MVVDHLAAEDRQEKIGVACMYLNHKEAESQTPKKLLSGLWRQLVLGRNVGSLARELYRQHQEKSTTLSLDEAFDVLRSAVAEFLKVYIVIDAIDEYPEIQRQILLKFLTMMGPTVNLMITSRPHISPNGSLPNLGALEIRANEGDLQRYVDAQIQISSRLSKHIQTRADLQEEIHSRVTRAVDGMYVPDSNDS